MCEVILSTEKKKRKKRFDFEVFFFFYHIVVICDKGEIKRRVVIFWCRILSFES